MSESLLSRPAALANLRRPRRLAPVLWHALPALWLGVFAQHAVAAKSERPDVILVVLDDFGHGYLNANFAGRSDLDVTAALRQRDSTSYDTNVVLANMRVAMPTIDRLVSEGLRFSQAYATNSLCGPSRLSILTGRHSAGFGINTNTDTQIDGMPPTDTYDYPAEAIRRQGYATAAVGKWHSSDANWRTAKRDDPISAGFDSFYGFNDHGTNYYESGIIYSSQANGVYKKVTQKAGEFLIDNFTDQAVKVLNKKRTGNPPVLLYLAYNAIHGPLLVSALAPEAYRVFNTGSRPADLLLSYMRAVDSGVAKLLEAQTQRGRLNKTLLLFVSDNGSPGDKAYVAPANSPYDGFKGQQLEGGLKIPMFAYGPGTIAAGRSYDGLVSTMDLIPTAMVAAGLEPAGLDGRPLQRLFAGNWPTGDNHHASLFAFGHNAGSWSLPGMPRGDQDVAPGGWLIRTPERVMIFTAGDQYLVPGSSSRGLPKRSLYEAGDAAQTNDLSLLEPGTMLAMESSFWSWFATLPAPKDSATSTYWRDLTTEEATSSSFMPRVSLLPRKAKQVTALQGDICRSPR